MRPIRILSVLAFTWSCMGSPAVACGICVLGMADLFFPPIVLWFFLPFSWFVLTGVVSTVFRRHFPFQPGLFASIGITAAAFVAGAAMLGPLASLPLVIPPIYAFLSVAFSIGKNVPTGLLRRVV